MDKPKPMSERELQYNVIDYARKLGYTLIYHTWNSRHSPAGFPDLVLCRVSDGRCVYIELKSQKGTVKAPQQEWLDGLEACGQEVYVFRPSDLDSDRIINILQYKNPGKQWS
jgi:RecB family endonuclease NucS